jgi:Flp pilus assembly protein TadD
VLQLLFAAALPSPVGLVGGASGSQAPLAPDARVKVLGGPPASHPLDAALEQARSALLEGKLADAEQLVRSELREHPDSGDAHFLLGYILFKRGEAAASLAEYTAGARVLDPEAADLKVVALDYVLLNDYPDADKWLTRSVQTNAADSEAWYYLGRTKYTENRFEEALQAFTQCLKLSPGNVKAETNLGLTLEALHRTDEALADYKQAISWDERNAAPSAEPWIDMGSLLLEQNRTEDAATALREAVTLAPADARARQALGTAYFRLDDLSDAQTELEKSVQLDGTSGPVHYLLGQVYRKLGRMDEAKREFDRAAHLSATPAAGMGEAGKDESGMGKPPKVMPP